MSIPCVIFEDDHLLVVNKPAGMNTHAPAPFAGEGIYDWLRHREQRWARLAIIHRLDKETSGVIVFSKTELANRSLTGQFAQGTAQKSYLLATDRAMRRKEFAVESALVRAGPKYVARPMHTGGERAKTCFRVVGSNGGWTLVEAKPHTGKTHQIRVHAAASGFPVLGDTLYGGSPFARVCLHAAEITLLHPNGETVTYRAPADFYEDTRQALRSALIDARETNAHRVIHGAPDGWPGWYVDRLGGFLLSQSEQPLTDEQRQVLTDLVTTFSLRGAYHKTLARQIRKTTLAQASPGRLFGHDAPDEFVVRENGVQFALRFNEGYSVGLFLDQRDNRRRLLTGHVAAGFPFKSEIRTGKPEILNAFAYTCGFSVCAALAGARTTSLDLSKKYLEWGKHNFALNGLEAIQHEFICGDVFDWLRRLAKKNRLFDAVVLDPPTFSQSKEHGVFQAEKDFGKLVAASLPLLKVNGVLFASTNAAKLSPEKFLDHVSGVVTSARRNIVQQHYAPQPPDFPITRTEPAYLKTVWLRIR